MKDTLFYIVSSIVDNPDEIDIKEEETDDFVTFTISVAKEDMGKIIGKEGKIIRSLRNVMRIPALKSGKRIQINLASEEE